MKYPRNAKIFRGQLEVAPFLGVFFLLAIFLLLQSHLAFPPGVVIQLPQADGAELPGIQQPTAVVAMDLGGQLYFESQVIDASRLRTRLIALARSQRDVTLVLQVDKGVKLEAFFRLGKLASEAGITRVLLAARPATPANSPGRNATP